MSRRARACATGCAASSRRGCSAHVVSVTRVRSTSRIPRDKGGMSADRAEASPALAGAVRAASLSAALALTRKPFAEARTLPAEAYTSPAVFALEQEELFGRSWLCVGREAD